MSPLARDAIQTPGFAFYPLEPPRANQEQQTKQSPQWACVFCEAGNIYLLRVFRKVGLQTMSADSTE